MGLGLQLRSSINDDLLGDDNEVVRLRVTNHKRLSRLHWEDILAMHPRSSFVLYMKWDQSLIGGVYIGIPGKARLAQLEKKAAGKFITVFGEKFFVLKATIFKADAHIKANAGSLTYASLKTLCDHDEGFGI